MSAPVLRVLEHNALVYRRTYRGTLFTTFLSPVLFLTAMGLGLGALVDRQAGAALGGVPYLAFLAPGLLAASAMQTGAFENTFPVMAKTTWWKTYDAMLATPLAVRDSRGYNFAAVTAGGIPLEEIDPARMESRIRTGLYLVGEILDVDGRLGGFNFQWAWSSAWVAAHAIARAVAPERT